tara:strand:- start:383 stop:649 length:267 start_codon:yes stop_codon:yes gene_type:complete
MSCCLLGCIYHRSRLWLDVDTGILSSDKVDYSSIPNIPNRYNLLEVIEMFKNPKEFKVLNSYMIVKMENIAIKNLDILEKIKEIVKEM